MFYFSRTVSIINTLKTHNYLKLGKIAPHVFFDPKPFSSVNKPELTLATIFLMFSEQ